MLALDIGRSTKTRVSIDEPSSIQTYAAAEELTREVEPGTIVPTASEVIVEVAAKVGPFVRYGSLRRTLEVTA